MQSRLDPLIETHHRSRSTPNRRHETVPEPNSRFQRLLFALAVGIAMSGIAHATSTVSEGMIGWAYHIGVNKTGHAATPHEACALSARNHMGTTLRFMRGGATERPSHRCFYPHFLSVGGVRDFYITRLYCEKGYYPKAPGLCVKWPEVARAPSFSPGQPGFAVGNPVAVSSGAKIQWETDFQSSPN